MSLTLTTVSIVLLVIVIALLLLITAFIAYFKGVAAGDLDARKEFRLICVECRWGMRPPRNQRTSEQPKEEPRTSKVHF